MFPHILSEIESFDKCRSTLAYMSQYMYSKTNHMLYILDNEDNNICNIVYNERLEVWFS